MPKISVIIPIYNIANYLPKCINSILNQTFEDFELLLIDDGSTDDSVKICNSFAKVDRRVLVVQKENGGVSSARNLGIKKATGEYIAFIDGDDYVSSDYLEKLIKPHSDLCICGGCYAKPDGSVLNELYPINDDISLISDEKILCWFEKGLMYSVWGRLFRLSIILDHNILFDENTTRGEDTIFMFRYIDYCKKAVFLSEKLYFYVKYVNEGSSSGRLNMANVKALNHLDNYIDHWLKQHKQKSDLFYSCDYWTKAELKDYYMLVFNNTTYSFSERYKWNKLFLSLPLFTDNSEEFFEKKSKKFRRIVSTKSSLLISVYQILLNHIRGNYDT